MSERFVTPPGEPARSLRLSVWEGAASTVHGALTGSIVVTAYAILLGADDFQFGLITALGTVAMLGTLLGARAVGHLGARRGFVAGASLGGRLLWGLLCVLPFLALTNASRMAVFLGVIFLGNLAVQAATAPWTSWMTDLVPLERRGRYFGVRSTICSAVGMVAGYAVGTSFDFTEAHVRGAGWNPAATFLPFLGLSTVFAVAGFLLFRRQWEPPAHGETSLSFAEMIRRPLANPDFRRLLRFYLLWGILCYCASPFWVPHMMKNLQMSKSTIALYGIFSGVAGLVAQPLWGRIIDRMGTRPVLVLNMAGVVCLPLLWLPARPDFLLPIWIDAALTGLFWPGLNLATFNLAIATAPGENRTAHLAVLSLVTGLAQCAAALLGGVLANALAAFHWVVGPFAFINFHILFVLSALGRLAMIPMALRLRDDQARPVRATLEFTTDKLLQAVGDGFAAGLAAVRRMAGR